MNWSCLGSEQPGSDEENTEYPVNGIWWLGDASAQNKLRDCYCYGRGVEQGYKEAAKWYEKAADQGDARGQYKLGFCYCHGNGVQKDKEKGKFLYQKAIDQNYWEAVIENVFCENTQIWFSIRLFYATMLCSDKILEE